MLVYFVGFELCFFALCVALQVYEIAYASQYFNFSRKSMSDKIVLSECKSWTGKKAAILNLISIRMSSFDIVYDVERYKKLFLLIRKSVFTCLSFGWNTSSFAFSFMEGTSEPFENSSEVSLCLRRIFHHLLTADHTMFSSIPAADDNYNQILLLMTENCLCWIMYLYIVI
jgi:hypothetical protein